MADLDGTTFLTGANAGFIGELYTRFLADPNSVDESWRRFFSEMGDDLSAVLRERRGPAWAKSTPLAFADGGAPATEVNIEAVRQAAVDSISALNLIRAYRVRGHLEADLDPLGLEKRGPHPELDYHSYGFVEADLDREISINNLFGRERATLREIVAILRATYCGRIGAEYMHIQVPAERAWIQEKFEKQKRPALSPSVKKEILQTLTAAETFERFLDRRYTGTKRFGIEGAESLMPALEAILRRGNELGIREFVIGMPHRGRLNVLANFVGKPFAAIFAEFQGNATQPEQVHGSGDVKYHLGTSGDREVGGRTVHLSLAANPSHLEAVDPVVLGKVRAKQYQRGDSERTQIAGILMHGDAAFAGQGLVAESLELSELAGFATGGAIHVIVNNQIGFTTSPSAARSSPYPSDMAKGVQAPIFHVNGDDPEAVVEAARTATEYRQQFKKDVVIDLFCYRRHGHNEADEPAFTQPLMYRAIEGHPTTRQIYADRLVTAGIVDEAEADAMTTRFIAGLEEQFEAAKGYRPNKADWLEGAWAGLEEAPDDDRRGDTGVTVEMLREMGE
ncbi:MAG TPA: thiamine pyrophosphate-dependent enzyme, partial [Stellaceae bacterium]|nr:thiamine pyrophosphate-dependent enzyme [Stellaceae bacterium]